MNKDDSYPYHELLHTTHMITEIIQQQLINHHTYELLPEAAQEKIEDAARKLADAYQKIDIHMDDKFD